MSVSQEMNLLYLSGIPGPWQHKAKCGNKAPYPSSNPYDFWQGNKYLLFTSPLLFSVSPMLPLFLHVSALSDWEHGVFTTSFANLVASDASFTTDSDFETYTVTVREAGAWLRGRYPDVSVNDCNKVSISLSPPGASFLIVIPLS